MPRDAIKAELIARWSKLTIEYSLPPLRAFGHPMRSITCPSRRASREGGKLVARTQLPRPGLHSMLSCRSFELLRCVFLAVVLGEHSGFHKWRILPLSCTVSNQACCPSGAGAVVQKIKNRSYSVISMVDFG